MAMVTPAQTFIVEQGKVKEVDLKLGDQSATALAVTPMIENNKGLKIDQLKAEPNAKTVKVRIDATAAKPDTYTVQLQGDNLMKSTFQVKVTAKGK
jgi:hypothetical protein